MYDVDENIEITFASLREIKKMNAEQVQIYQTALKELQEEIKKEMAYVDMFGAKEYD